MSTAALWVRGARPRTLGAGIVPVVVGTAAAGSATWPRALGALAVALGLQVGVNYANDYFDGTRGVDSGGRAGPPRLTASGAAPARLVLAAAAASFAIAGVAGAWLALATEPWLLSLGALAIAAALTYSGGPRPYAGLGLGELSVLLFFGFLAVCGTAYVQHGSVTADAWWAAGPVGLLAVAILMANNVRDADTDAAAGKRTLAVRLGNRASRALFRVTVALALLLPVLAVATGAASVAWLLTLTALPLAAGPLISIGYAVGPELIRTLNNTAMLHAQFGAMLAIALWMS
ncbi:MAG TPA: 1,4-dihydroxy-2-naphthoate polyprenyltransferase [Actinomycetota bacterium]